MFSRFKPLFLLFLAQVGAGLFFNWLMLTGLKLTNANSAGLITSLLPAIIVSLNVTLFKQKLNPRMIIAINALRDSFDYSLCQATK